MAPPENDAFGTDLPAMLAVMTPWPSLATASDPATTHPILAEADFDLMVEHVLALAGT